MRLWALFVVNSNRKGLASTKKLLAAGWDIVGVSSSESAITSAFYHHQVADVSGVDNSYLLNELAMQCPVDICIYLAEIGELLRVV